MRSEPFQRKPNDPNPENSDVSIEKRIAAEHSFFRDLPSALQEQIANMPTDCPLFSMGNGRFGSDDDEGALMIKLDSLPASVQEKAKSKATAIFSTGDFSFNFDNAWVSFTNGGFVVMANIITDSGRETGTAFTFRSDIAPEASMLMLDQSLLSFWIKQMGKDIPESWKQLAAYQSSYVWKNDAPVLSNRVQVAYPRAAVLKWLSDEAGIEFVSDYYMRGDHRIPEELKKSRPVLPLKKELDFQAKVQDMSWKQRSDSIYLFRNNRWYRDDALEIPLPILQRLYRLKREMNPPPKDGQTALTETAKLKQQMDWDAEALHSLSLYQIAMKLRSFSAEMLPVSVLKEMPTPTEEEGAKIAVFGNHPFRSDVDRLSSRLNTTRFYASLDDNLRQALVNGRLSFSLLSLEQKKIALFLLPRLRPLTENADNTPVFLKLIPRPGFSKYGGGVRLSFFMEPPP